MKEKSINFQKSKSEFLAEMFYFLVFLIPEVCVHEKILISSIRILESIFPQKIRKSSSRESLFKLFRNFFSSRKILLEKVYSLKSSLFLIFQICLIIFDHDCSTQCTPRFISTLPTSRPPIPEKQTNFCSLQMLWFSANLCIFANIYCHDCSYFFLSQF